MRKGFAAALLILTLSASCFAGDTLTPQKHNCGTTITTTTISISWMDSFSTFWQSLFY
jgi:hypothetical protein